MRGKYMGKKKTIQEFIQDIRTKRPELDFLDFSEAKYNGKKTPIKIYCKKHDEWFWETPGQLLNPGSVSCPKCKEESEKTTIRKNFENGKRRFLRFLEENFEGYSYDIEKYEGCLGKFKIVSPDGKEVNKTPTELRTLIKREQDKRLGNKKMSKVEKKKEILISKILGYTKDIDTSKINYINYTTPVQLVCKKHPNEEIWMTPTTINRRIKKNLGLCSRCVKEREVEEKTEWFKSEWKKRLYPELEYYDLSDVVFTECRDKISVHCNKHNETFEVNPLGFLNYHQTACPGCCSEKMSAARRAQEAEEFFKWLNEEHPELDSSQATYVDSNTKLLLFCKNHPEREIWLSPWDIKFNQPRLGHEIVCPFCREEKYGKSRSFGESLVYQWFEKNDLLTGLNEQVQINNCDLKFPNINKDYILVDFIYKSKDGKIFWIEYNGEQHYINTRGFGQDREYYERQVIRDWCEEEHCKASGITLIIIPYNIHIVSKVWEVLDDVIVDGNDPTKWYREVKDRDQILKKNNLI